MSGEQRLAWDELPCWLGTLIINPERVRLFGGPRGMPESSRCFVEPLLGQASDFSQELLLLRGKTAHQHFVLLLLLNYGPVPHELEV